MRFEVISVLAFGAGIAAAADDQGLLLKIEVTQQVSCSKQTKLGDTLHVNYNGTLTNGTLFDSSECHRRFMLGCGRYCLWVC